MFYIFHNESKFIGYHDSFHILLTGKSFTISKFSGENKILTETDKKHQSGARICDITVIGADL